MENILTLGNNATIFPWFLKLKWQKEPPLWSTIYFVHGGQAWQSQSQISPMCRCVDIMLWSHPGIIPGVQCVHPDGSGELGNTHTVIILSIQIKSGLFLRHSQAFPSLQKQYLKKYIHPMPCIVRFFSYGIHARQTTIVNAFKTWHLLCHLAGSTDCSRLSRVILPISSQTTLCQYLKGISKTIRIFII